MGVEVHSVQGLDKDGNVLFTKPVGDGSNVEIRAEDFSGGLDANGYYRQPVKPVDISEEDGSEPDESNREELAAKFADRVTAEISARQTALINGIICAGIIAQCERIKRKGVPKADCLEMFIKATTLGKLPEPHIAILTNCVQEWIYNSMQKFRETMSNATGESIDSLDQHATELGHDLSEVEWMMRL